MAKTYDYIIAGGGCAGLSLAYKMLLDPFFNDKTILLLEKVSKNKNDRTWCHWSTKESIFDSIVIKSWDKISVHDYKDDLNKTIAPFKYKMIKGIDFYNFLLPKLDAAKNIDFIQSEVTSITSNKGETIVETLDQTYSSKLVFKSFFKMPEQIKDHWVLQHFKGYFVKSDNPYFNEEKIRFMDFRTPQNGEVRFFYVLPTSKTEALVEIAIFSQKSLDSKEYDPIIKNYIKEYLPKLNYQIVEEELGSIPMTTYDFASHDTDQVINIGTAGGCVKASSGFAFERIQNHTDEIIRLLKLGENPRKAQNIFKSKYKLFDKIFMNVLLTNKEPGDQVFMDLFKKLAPQLVLKFLNEDSSFLEELKLFTAPPTLSFMKGFFEEV